jgi:hypothetical protein
MNVADQAPSVDFVLNVFERTYRSMLQPGHISAMWKSQVFPFTNKVVLVNNILDRGLVESLLAPLLASNEITAYYFVQDLLDSTLSQAGLTRKEIQKTIHYTDCILVATFLPGSPFLVYCDADVVLKEPVDWISPGLTLMEQDKRIAVVNPDWNPSTLKEEAREFKDHFGIGYGFSDQIFLVSRQEFARPIYRNRAPISRRYPLSHLAPVFEQMVDSYMRLHGRLRATYTPSVYLHVAEEGATYAKMNIGERLGRLSNTAIVRLCQLIPGNDPRFSL